MNNSYTLTSPAKLNLFLKVINKETCGYHNILSLLTIIDWRDEITFTFNNKKGDVVVTSDCEICEIESNTCFRSAQLLRKFTSSDLGIEIFIKKNIPMGGGMGGGSSNAATCLIALNRIWNLNIPYNQLETLSLKIGCDVPFFIRGKNALVAGKGEIITPKFLSQKKFLIIFPNLPISTRDVFSQLSSLEFYKIPKKKFLRKNQKFYYFNDLEEIVVNSYKEVAEVILILKQLGLQPRMTGSGSAVFSQVSEQQIRVISPTLEFFLRKKYKIKICNNLQSNPVLEFRCIK